MTTAPIVLFVYNRPIYTQRTVESLKQNEIAGESQLYIYSDGPKNESDQQQVEQVREYVKTITGFKKVWIIEHEKNWGLSRSIISGISEIINQFGRVIVMEDDLLSSPYFLRFMNEALNYYEKEENVISISGYFFPINDCNIPETFFLRWADCWGWATWKRGWDLFEADGKKILDIIQSENLEAAFNMDDSYPYTQMLRDQINHKNDSWGIRWYASSFIKKRLTLCTNMSLIHNFGCNQSGSHFLNETTALDSKLRQIPVKISPIPIVEDHYSKQQVFQFYERTYKHDNHKSFFKKKFVALNHLSLSNKSKMINKIFNLPHHILHYIYIKLKKQILPPLYGWSGNYPSWEAALHDSKGYDSPDIFTKLKTASLKVKSGEAVYERDSVLFDKIEYSWPLLAGLMWIASQKENT
ncbi:MAG: glycosyltransferase, partial [Candidatus Aureabacteria bacterium]|nr:glycosyltransferase [Candidatus Auribacterota bacterium]